VIVAPAVSDGPSGSRRRGTAPQGCQVVGGQRLV
jgi:hypothetical protein